MLSSYIFAVPESVMEIHTYSCTYLNGSVVSVSKKEDVVQSACSHRTFLPLFRKCDGDSYVLMQTD